MASLMQENWGECINGQDGLDEFESLEIDNTLLMSILNESHLEEECDNEKLSSVIRSLEAEIDPIVIDDHDSSLEVEWNSNWEDGHQHSNGTHIDGLSCSNLDYNWMEMDDMSSMYLQCYEDSMGGIIEFGGVRDYYQIPYVNNNLEEQHGYGALWQETN